MDKLAQILNEKILEMTLVLVVTFISFFIYLSSTTEPIKSRLRGGLQGALIALVLAIPTWTYIGHNNLAALVIITVILCTSGQFLPELIQMAFKKYATKWIKEKTGDSE